MNITEKLDQLAWFQSERDAVAQEYLDKRESLIPPDLKAEILAVDVEYSARGEALLKNIDALTAEVKAEVIASGATVKGAHLQAVYVRGRVSWDTSKLDVYAKAYPEIAELRREGEPTVQIRAVK